MPCVGPYSGHQHGASQMPTTFGTEFECLMPAGKTRADLVAALVVAIGKGPTACQFVEYRNAHQTSPRFGK